MGGRGSSANRNSIKFIDDHKLHKIDFDGGYAKYIIYNEDRGNVLYIDELHTDLDKRGKGIGSKMLEELKKANMLIELSAYPFDKGMTSDELKEWYKKRGFMDEGNNRLLYTPKRK